MNVVLHLVGNLSISHENPKPRHKQLSSTSKESKRDHAEASRRPTTVQLTYGVHATQLQLTTRVTDARCLTY